MYRQYTTYIKIRCKVRESINNEIDKKYKNINQKLTKLEGTQASSYEQHSQISPNCNYCILS